MRRRRKHENGTMDIILALLGLAITIFTVTMIVIFCIYQTIPDTLVQCFFTCCGSEGGFMALIMIAKKITENGGEND